MVFANMVLNLWESWGGFLLRAVRKRGLAFAADYMHAEDEQTNYVCIGPVNKVGGAPTAPLPPHRLHRTAPTAPLPRPTSFPSPPPTLARIPRA